jgi:toxin ParE1/3/4
MILKRQRAILSINEQTDWIIEENPEAAIKFVESVESSFSLLEKNPEIGRSLATFSRRLIGVRIWKVSNFEKYLIFYRPIEEGIEVLDVIHGARDLPTILGDLL